ncbi:Serpentine Receptor, class Z [Caenorhabditis elegans]|uniref:Serpentine Receptor, class Z n=1 Tax=Caenorhabditis elegans TaxID=6239 RepID=O44580_CAEEL|nr:Serpentine Receptor, class Z [Caenorhabditis elegans]CCD74375.2 Serpentine Receptor, class Z [Caenorhabditis elegans]|eukprot:NP_503498.3 Uncharacterized protein CELE_ZK697.1 [Caenorhabditis elegans]
MEFLIFAARSYKEHENSLDTLFLDVMDVVMLFIHTTNCIFFLLLLLYKRRNRKAEKRVKFKEFHAPIFQQLFFIAGCTLFINSINLFTRLIADRESNYSLAAMLTIALFIYISIGFVFGCIISFTFLATMQRILILHFAQYKWLLIKSQLNIAIFVVYCSMASYSVINYNFYLQKESLLKTDLTVEMWHNLFNGMLLLMTFITGCFYYYIRGLMQRLTPEMGISIGYLLQQFGPIYSVQVIYILASIIETILYKFDICQPISLIVSLTLVHTIPTIVSLSYCATKENIRAITIRVLRLALRETTV